MVDLQALRFDLGTPWLNLLGSRGSAYGDRPIERMTGPDRLAEWLAHEGLLPVGAAFGEADVARAVRLRETLRPLVLAVARAETPEPSAVAALNEFLAADAPVVLEPSFAVAPPADLDAALARIARQAAVQLTGPDAAHLRLCGDEACSGAYLDPTGRRRWCADERCGVRSRVRAHRARQKDPGSR